MLADQLNSNFMQKNWEVGYLLPHDSDLLSTMLPRLDSDVYLMEEKANGSVAFYEIYSIQQKVKVVQPLATWSTGRGFSPIQEKWLRRKDLSKAKFRVGTSKDFPFVEYPSDWDFKDQTLIRGMAVDVLVAFQAHHGFEMELVKSIDGEWGDNVGNNTWNGLIGMASRREVDFVATSLTLTPERADGKTCFIIY